MCGARRVLQAFVGKRPQDDFPAVFVWGLVKYYQVSVISSSVFFARRHLFETGTVRPNSGFPLHGQDWRIFPSTFGRAACRVPCAHCVCIPGI